MKNELSILSENRQTSEKLMYFRTSKGVTLQSTESEFNRNWKDYILARGETYTMTPIEDQNLSLATFDDILRDRAGREFSVWYIYVHGQIQMVQYTRYDLCSPVDRVEFEVAA